MSAVPAEDILTTFVNYAKKMKLFKAVIMHEPRGAPKEDPTACFFTGGPKGAPGEFVTVAARSGLASASMRLDVMCRIYMDAKRAPLDKIDSNILAYTEAILRSCNENISLGLATEGVWTDSNGADSDGLGAQIGYTDIDDRKFRISEIYIPVIITDYFPQVS
jgi:hypothetical protein